VISFDRKFIFTKIGKTGGTSIQNDLLKQTKSYDHLNHWHITEDLNGHDPSKYFKFAFIRNPWDRMVSKWFFIQQGFDFQEHYYGHTFRDYILDTENKFKLKPCEKHSPKITELHNKVSPWDTYTDWISNEDGEILCDFVGRFENLQVDYNRICDIIGIDKTILPIINKTDREDYRIYYDDDMIEVVANKYKKDIKLFKYEF